MSYYGSDIKLIITNTCKDGGSDWVDFPISKHGFQKLRELNIRGRHYEVSGASFVKCYKACEILCDTRNLDKINWLARIYYTLSAKGKELFRMISESGCMELKSIDDLLILITNLSNFKCLKGVSNYEALAAYYLYIAPAKSPITLDKDTPKEYYNLVGLQISDRLRGGFCDGHYFYLMSPKFQALPEEVPSEYKVRF